MASSMDIQARVWSMTAWTVNTTAEEKKREREALQSWLTKNCTKWSFQLETTGTDDTEVKVDAEEKKDEVFTEVKRDGLPVKDKKHHWQIMFCLFKKVRGRTLISTWKKATLPGGHLCVVSTNNGDKMEYTMKMGAVDGPWTSEMNQSDDEEPADITKLKTTVFPWQKAIYEWSIEPGYEERTINVMVDPEGCSGKSKCKRYIKWMNKDATDCPPYEDFKDMTRFVFSMIKERKTRNCFFIDIPRSFDPKDKKIRKMWGALETIKDGNLFEDRFCGKSKMITPPKIWVFTNGWPPLDVLSKDRWKFWGRNEKNELVRIQHPDTMGGGPGEFVIDFPEADYE